MSKIEQLKTYPAAFGRLCVETRLLQYRQMTVQPAAFGRLCVETAIKEIDKKTCNDQPPSGGCVLKQTVKGYH